MGIEQPRTRIAHLLRRAGFGGTEEEIDRYTSLGFDAAVTDLVEFSGKPDAASDAAEQQAFDLGTPDGLRAWWLYRMIETSRPLQEKMTLFWHGHFATGIAKVRDPLLMRWQNDLFRNHALGNFRTLVKQVSRDPAMLRWLDGNANRKAAPNENYARELMELFTLGVGNYSEDDVKAAARAFTGWFIDPVTLSFTFTQRAHDFGNKTFLGTTGPLDGDDVVDTILAQPVAPAFLARKLFRAFVYDDPEPETVQRYADLLTASDWETKPVVEALLRSPEFSSERAYHARIKGPVEMVVGTIRSLSASTAFQDLFPSLRRMGQDLFNPPNVKGWDGGLAWVSTSTMFERFNFANRLCSARDDRTRTTFDPAARVAARGLTSGEQIVDHFSTLLVDGDVPPDVRSTLVSYLNEPSPFDALGDGPARDAKLRGLVHLIMSTPVYQSA
ncbi:MAG: DUF1800 domain-containing protein [Chloroflexi bacterium]|nr:DUF1800 domain-containing protein [Chloroflexota bacterium]